MSGSQLDKVYCRISEVFERTDGILEIDIKKDEQFDLLDMQELIQAAKDLGKGKKFLNLIIVGDRTIPNKEARDFSSSPEGCAYKLADAFVINSLAQKLIGNFIIKHSKPPVPTAVFKRKDEAVKWLLSLKV